MLQIVHDMNALDAQYQSDTNQYNVVQGEVVDAESNYNQATADDDPNADYYYSQWTDLSNQLMRIDASIQQERAARFRSRRNCPRRSRFNIRPPGS